MSIAIPEFPALLAEAAGLADEFARTAAHHDATGEFPFANFNRLHEAGLLRLVTAREHGGFGDIILDDVVVPLENLIEAQPASEPLRRPEAATAFFFSSIRAVYQGVARAARDRLIGFLAAHTPASLGAPLSTVPRVQEG